VKNYAGNHSSTVVVARSRNLDGPHLRIAIDQEQALGNFLFAANPRLLYPGTNVTFITELLLSFLCCTGRSVNKLVSRQEVSQL
jgi:hypothetical protein